MEKKIEWLLNRKIDRVKVIYISVIIRDFWTVTFEHTDLRFSAHSSLR